jgi:TfoX/Sxy family transcriptional regulator of competence genes
VRSALDSRPIAEQKMFGGVCFMLNGNMLVGASPRGLMVRTGKDAYADALARPHAEPMRQSSRVMPGYVVVANEGLARDADLASWLDLALAFVGTLPPKAKTAPPPRPAAKPASKASRRPA